MRQELKLVFADFLGSWRMAYWRGINRGAIIIGAT